MATAKKRTKKTAAAPTAAKKTPATKGARQSTTKADTKKKATTRKPADKSAGAGKKAAAARSTTTKTTTPIRGATAKKTTAKTTTPIRGATAKKTTAKKTTAKKPALRRVAGKARPAATVDPELFLPLTEGERAEVLRILLEDARLSSMASVGRYRVIAVEPLAVKPPHGLSARRLARVVIYDYAGDRSVDACVDLDHGRVAFLNLSRAQPMLAREEEAAAISIALSDERVKEQLSLGEEPQVAMHYWSNSNASLSFARRSAAVIFGRPDSSPSLIAVVDLLDNLVSEIVPATHW
jgi:Cu2+-containing amine oxidase